MIDIRWVKLCSVKDDRGCLTVIEGGQDMPFNIQRVFYMHGVVQGANRGGHAHRDTDQLVVAVHGSVDITLSDGEETIKVLLRDPLWALFIPRMTWTRLYNFTNNGVCLVLASTHYDISASIRNWQSFLEERRLSSREEQLAGTLFLRPDQ